MDAFNQFIDNEGMVKMTSLRGHLSWCNGHSGWTRSWACLDRVLCDSSCLETFPGAHMKYLSRVSSDHSPIIISLLDGQVCYGPSLYKFQQMWTSHESFHGLVARTWMEEMSGNGLWWLAGKLKKLKIALKVWNKEVFGWTQVHIQNLEKELEGLESNLQAAFYEEDEYAYLAIKLELETWEKREEMRLAQQVKQRLDLVDLFRIYFHGLRKLFLRKKMLSCV
ncbi:uncharacterized protein LOC121243514 [Juglans microcarpa x Juglans regia]|uniref:uncharacterized protein LOC121243514 n=1 Tax=Juglans microcarpa x Juglans regia TaxID=2249226 RepID=UPI001B7DB9F9|nr:uncharacterized protein LOC121243514 [Juglans microcarpa x Juglans regia]